MRTIDASSASLRTKSVRCFSAAIGAKVQVMVPAVPGVFIQSLDLEQNRMEIHMMEGLATDEN